MTSVPTAAAELSSLLDAELNDTATADAVWNALPITASGNIWGDEIYLRVPVDTELKQGQEVVDLGDLGYW